MGMVKSRSTLLEQAINSTLGSSRQLIFEDQIGLKTSESSANIQSTIKSIPQNEPIKSSTKEVFKSNSKTKNLNQGPNLTHKEISQSIDGIDNKAKQLSDFFNGKVLDPEI